MKHRSIGVFIMLVAVLAAVPEASQQLQTIKSSLGERVRAELLSALANLQTQGRGSAVSPRRLQTPNTPAPELARASSEAARKTRKAATGNVSPTSVSAGAPARHANEVAEMLIDPTGAIPLASAARNVHVGREMQFAEVAYSVAPKMSQQDFETLRDIAMIIPPGVEGSSSPSLANSRRTVKLKREASVRARELAETEKNAAVAAVRFSRGEAGTVEIKGEELRQHFENLFKTDSHLRTNMSGTDTLLKFMKVRRVNKSSAPMPVGKASCPGKLVASLSVEAPMPSIVVAPSGE